MTLSKVYVICWMFMASVQGISNLLEVDGPLGYSSPENLNFLCLSSVIGNVTSVLLEGIIVEQSVDCYLLSASVRCCDNFKRNTRNIQVLRGQTRHI